MSIFKRYLQIRYHLIGIFLVLFIMLIPSEKAHAAGFRHVHTPACYSQQSVVCNKHHIRRDEHQANYHCFTCQYQLMFTEVTYWSVCENSGQNGYPVWPDRDVAYVQTCPNCGSTRRNEAPPSYYEHTVTISVLSCGFDESSTAATVSLTPSLTDWTNGPVTLTAGVNISDPSFSLAGSPYDFGAGASGSNSVEVFSNGTYSVTVRSADGQSATETVTVSNIDTTAPSLNLSLNTDGWCESGIKVLASASDGESGLADEAYSYNGGAFTSSGEFTATANGDVRVAVRDKAGNVTEQTITVSKVGRDPAVIAAEREAAERAAAEQARIERERAEKKLRSGQPPRKLLPRRKLQRRQPLKKKPPRKPLPNKRLQRRLLQRKKLLRRPLPR